MSCWEDVLEDLAEFAVGFDGADGFVDGAAVDACNSGDADGWDFDLVEIDFFFFDCEAVFDEDSDDFEAFGVVLEVFFDVVPQCSSQQYVQLCTITYKYVPICFDANKTSIVKV